MTGRRLREDERVLWKGVIRSIVPLRRLPKLSLDDVPPAPENRTRGSAKSGPAATAQASAPKAPAMDRGPPPLTSLTRKTKQRIARGRHAIDGRLDLHGMTQDEAHGALLSFLRGRQARGAKVVLVITGKGGRGEGGGRGVLKRMVPLWLGLPELRGLVIGFETAGAGHGGEGALYVSLRRPR
jgi:DNA-nicking Smr family endonuclease